MGVYLYRLLAPKTTLPVQLPSGELVAAHGAVYAFKPTTNPWGKSKWELLAEARLAFYEKAWMGQAPPSYVIELNPSQHRAIKARKLDLSGATLYQGPCAPSFWDTPEFGGMQAVGHFHGPAEDGIFVAKAEPKRFEGFELILNPGEVFILAPRQVHRGCVRICTAETCTMTGPSGQEELQRAGDHIDVWQVRVQAHWVGFLQANGVPPRLHIPMALPALRRTMAKEA